MFQESEERESEQEETGVYLVSGPRKDIGPEPIGSGVVLAAVGEAIILHYMDDVLLCAPNDDLLSHMLDLTIDSLVAAEFELQEEKIQRMPPWKYLGLEIGERTIALQKLAIKNNIRT
ncbi:hypothetical protein DUI87_22215 [Hirundo rustica rustica]|uniref:ribonuclease H n=1 Tax=Hirundo rustica rustica TaxID=333673 RepID=A0A3M0JJT3_HIRRU|nr:hypothetical protein DUI87_22215 [Hirundo rustica rustica]